MLLNLVINSLCVCQGLFALVMSLLTCQTYFRQECGRRIVMISLSHCLFITVTIIRILRQKMTYAELEFWAVMFAYALTDYALVSYFKRCRSSGPNHLSYHGSGGS